jgi:hypothetical protein
MYGRFMANDLYSADLRTISGSELYRAISEFIRLDQPIEDRPREGYLLDFKEDLSDRFLHSVAAFANTFGGTLIVGVSEDDGRPNKVVGVATTGELKTRVAGVIASNLFPCPPFEIAECGIPGDLSGKKLCVLRVRETDEICLLAKKGEKYPVYVRIEDQSPPADAAQLRSLLNRKAQNRTSNADIDLRIRDLASGLFVCTYRENTQGSRTRTFFQTMFCPYAHAPIRLDLAIEKIFAGLTSAQWPGLQQLVNISEARVEHVRSRDWYEIQFYDKTHDYERRWRLTNRADIGFITQTRWPITPVGDFWSLYDVVADLVRVGQLARNFWRETGHYGSCRVIADLNVEGLGFDTAKGALSPLFYARLGGVPDFSLDSRSLMLQTGRPQLTQAASARLDVNYTGLDTSLVETVTMIVNQLVRCFGHVPDFRALQRSLDSLFFQKI